MEGFTISGIDQVIVVAYFVFVFAFGSYFGRYIKGTSDFFFSGRKFAWWVIAFSMIATVVGSYSFIKYSAAGYLYGLSSSMSYLNDWFFMPLWMFGWLPIIYFTRMTSVPEYFERRFDTPTRVMAILFITVYLVGYIGINFYTLGLALNALLGVEVFTAALIVAIITAIYVTSGGQTAVIMTDLLQGVILLAAGIAIFVLGFIFLGDGEVIEGAGRFWEGLPEDHRYGLAHFNGSTKFSFIGVFWQDAVASTFAAYFFNQGILMRFLSLKSVNEGRKAMCVALAVLLPIAVIAVGNAGWLGSSIYNQGLAPEGYPPNPDPNNIFVVVTHIVTRVVEMPGVFGLIMAALLAALMSTADTLINATSAVVVNDIWRPYVQPGRSDRHYLNVARGASILAAILGLALVPVFMQFKSIYVAHGAFIAAVTPPTMVTIVLGFLWPRYTAKAAFWTMLGGAIAMGISVRFPELIGPLAHGVDPSGGFKYMRAFYGIVTSGTIAVGVTLCTRPSKSDQALLGLTIWTVRDAMRKFKGGDVSTEPGDKVLATLRVVDSDASASDEIKLSLHPDDLAVLNARPGDLIYFADHRWWLGGLRAAHARVRDDAGEKGVIDLSPAQIEINSLDVDRGVVIEKIL